MAKEKEKKLAYEFYINQKKTAKEIAEMIGVTEKTVGSWINKGGWKNLREAQVNSKTEQLDNIREVISILTNDRIKIQKEISDINDSLLKPEERRDFIYDLRRQAVSISDEISKWNKALENLDKENRISLSVYIHIMDDIFNHLRDYDSAIFSKTLDFQENHLNNISNKY